MKNKITSKDFRVTPGEKVNLKQWSTRVKPFCESKKQYKQLLEEQVEALSSLQRLHYASNRYAVLLIVQGMDAAGKDGAFRHVMSRVNDAPWHVVPADDIQNARLIISEILLDVFKGLKMAYPEPTSKRRRELQLIHKTLVK